jgi:serine/threonine protein kinase
MPSRSFRHQRRGRRRKQEQGRARVIEINAKALRDEHELFKLLKETGTVPSSPSPEDKDAPKAYGEYLEGYNYLVVDLMKCELLDIVTAKVEEARAQGDTHVDYSEMIVRLINMCQALRRCGYVNVDIKPENIMLGEDGILYYVDLGLARPIADEKVYNIGAGTPAFMALSAHTTSPSPREDIESTIYVISELFLRIKAAIRGEELKATDDTYLPWDLAASEDVVLQEKKKHVKDSESTFYKTMTEDAARLFMQALELNWECKYAEEPKYDQLRDILSKLRVPLEGDGNHQQRPTTPVVAATTKVAARICLPRRCRCNPSPVLRRL